MFTFKKSLIKEDLATIDIRIDGDTRNPKANPNKEIPREQLSVKDKALELIALHEEATGFKDPTWLSYPNCKGITKEQFNLRICIILWKINNGA